eukprot:SAG22_NODE_5910_length_932_cov_1.547419_2_plen_94_part_01
MPRILATAAAAAAAVALAVVGPAAAQRRTDNCQQAAFSCGAGTQNQIDGSFRCNGYTDCARLTGGGGGNNRAQATRSMTNGRSTVRVDVDELNC